VDPAGPTVGGGLVEAGGNDALLARIHELEQKVERLERVQPTAESAESPGEPLSRRRALGLAGATVVGAVGAAVANAAPASAGLTVSDLILNVDNQPTTLTTGMLGVSDPVLRVGNTSTGSAVSGTAVSGVGLFGSSTSSVATYGTSTSGAGLRGSTASGNSLQVDAPTTPNAGGGHMLLVPGSIAGPPTAGAHLQGQFFMDNTGRLFQCTTGGTPGTWSQILSLGRDQAVVPTTTTRLAASVSGNPVLWGVNSAAGIGVTGQAPNGTGVSGSTDAGIAISAAVNTPSSGVHLELLPTAQAGPPSSGAHALGQFVIDQNGVLFQCVAAGTPGTWVRQVPLVNLSAPVRVYDSRPAFGGSGALGTNGEFDVTVTNGTTIPHGVSAVLVNLTAVNPTAKSFMAIFKDGITWPGHSNLNYSAGATISNNATSAVSAATPGKVTVRNGASTSHFIVDVFGYYL
jgi:hypothetical protein